MKFRLAALAAVGVLSCGAGAATALAAGGKVLHQSGTYSVAAGKSRSVAVPFPDALEYGGSRYSGSVRILSSSGGFKILSRGSCLGGSEYCVKVHNGGRATARFKVTATTRLPG